MELSLNISGESISAGGKVIFMPKNADEYVFLYGGESFVISRDSCFLDTFLGRRSFRAFCGCGECVGRFRLHGLRKLEIELTLDAGRIVASLPLLGRWWKPNRVFTVGETSYTHQGKELILSNPACLVCADILTGCFLLSILSREMDDASGPVDMD